MSFSGDEMLLPRDMNLSTNFREPPFSVEISYWVNSTVYMHHMDIDKMYREKLHKNATN